MFEIDIPEIVSEVREAFLRYEQALSAEDFGAVNAMFWNDPRTLRYSLNGSQIGYEAITGFRHKRKEGAKIERTLRNTFITTFGRDFAITNTESSIRGKEAINRRSQTWIRTPKGWCVAAIHISDEASPKGDQK
jgi:hypothetical protein